MGRRKFTVSATLTLMLAGALSVPALANSTEDNLRRWYRSPLEFQITNDQPRVVMPTPPPAQASYIVNVGSFKQEPAPPPIMISPSRNPQYIVNVATPPAAGFQSNIPASTPFASNPPAGSSNSLLAGKLLPLAQYRGSTAPATSAAPRSLIKTRQANANSNSNAIPNSIPTPMASIKTYDTTSYGSGIQQYTDTKVIGKLK